MTVISLGRQAEGDLHTWVRVSLKGPSSVTGWRTEGRAETRGRGGRVEGTGGGAGVPAPRQQQRGQGAPRRCASAHPAENGETGASPAGYITLHRSAASAALYSAKHRMARPPGYATGAHVLAGCLPDHGSTVAVLISTPTHHTVFSKYESGYVYTGYCTYSTALCVEVVCMWTEFCLKILIQKGFKKNRENILRFCFLSTRPVKTKLGNRFILKQGILSMTVLTVQRLYCK